MLLINFFRKASVSSSAIKSSRYLMLFLFDTLIKYGVIASVLLILNSSFAKNKHTITTFSEFDSVTIENGNKLLKYKQSNLEFGKPIKTDDQECLLLIERADIAEKNLNLQAENFQMFGVFSVAIILALTCFLIYNFRTLKSQQLHNENDLQYALIAIKKQTKIQQGQLRIAQDLHEALGSRLSYILSSIDNLKYGLHTENDELTKKMDGLSELTASTIYELRDSIWAIHKEVITFEDLQLRVLNFIDKANRFQDKININFMVDTTVHLDHNFESFKGMNIYRVLQEAIRNSVKHSQATQITVKILQKLNSLQFIISDNGIGFDVEIIENSKGFKTIQKRVSEIGGQLLIKSTLNQGTQITILL